VLVAPVLARDLPALVKIVALIASLFPHLSSPSLETSTELLRDLERLQKYRGTYSQSTSMRFRVYELRVCTVKLNCLPLNDDCTG
jgi:hypothetical protein